MLQEVWILLIIITITLQQLQQSTQSFHTNTNSQRSFKMQFLAIVSLALAGLASAATIPEKRASTPPGCASACKHHFQSSGPRLSYFGCSRMQHFRIRSRTNATNRLQRWL